MVDEVGGIDHDGSQSVLNELCLGAMAGSSAYLAPVTPPTSAECDERDRVRPDRCPNCQAIMCFCTCLDFELDLAAKEDAKMEAALGIMPEDPKATAADPQVVSGTVPPAPAKAGIKHDRNSSGS